MAGIGSWSWSQVGEKPFGLQSYYTGKPLFGRTAQALQEKYAKTESLTYFDLWSCKG